MSRKQSLMRFHTSVSNATKSCSSNVTQKRLHQLKKLSRLTSYVSVCGLDVVVTLYYAVVLYLVNSGKSEVTRNVYFSSIYVRRVSMHRCIVHNAMILHTDIRYHMQIGLGVCLAGTING